MYNVLFGTDMKDVDVSFGIQPLHNTFLVHVNVFRRLMAFLDSAYLLPHMSDADIEYVDSEFCSVGGMVEALTGCFFALEIRRGLLRPFRMCATHVDGLKVPPRF
jgi:hypothetical protein